MSRAEAAAANKLKGGAADEEEEEEQPRGLLAGEMDRMDRMNGWMMNRWMDGWMMDRWKNQWIAADILS